MRRTKIVCTIGPATSSRARLAELISAGMDVARLNFSHGDHATHAEVIHNIRSIAASVGKPVAILQDLSGPKIRFGPIAGGFIQLKRGAQIVLREGECKPGEQAVRLPVPALLQALTVGCKLFADDGKIELRVIGLQTDGVLVRVIVGGPLGSHKGVTAPGVGLDIPAVMPKDIADLAFGLQNGVDWIAASYVRGPDDLKPLRETMARLGIHRPVIAKIEKVEAVQNLSGILDAADGVMVARGDLGVEAPIHEVPLLQKRIIRDCNAVGLPVITATQMLDSMMHNKRPTRAEVTDVANAILDGTDALMLSGETAMGDYPIDAVRMMAAVARRTETSLPDQRTFTSKSRGPQNVAESVASAAVEIATAVRAKAIVCATTSGSTARLISKYRPDTAIVGATSSETTLFRLALSWGVLPLSIGPVRDTDEMMEAAIHAVVEHRIARTGDRIVLTAGVPVNLVGSTNLIKVHVVGQPVRPETAIK